MKMKLFVWTDVLCDHAPGIMFAMAETAEQAREVITDSPGADNWVWEELIENEPKVYEDPKGFFLDGGA